MRDFPALTPAPQIHSGDGGLRSGPERLVRIAQGQERPLLASMGEFHGAGAWRQTPARGSRGRGSPLVDGGVGGERSLPPARWGCRGRVTSPPCSMGCRGERSLHGEWRSGDTVLMTWDWPEMPMHVRVVNRVILAGVSNRGAAPEPPPLARCVVVPHTSCGHPEVTGNGSRYRS